MLARAAFILSRTLSSPNSETELDQRVVAVGEERRGKKEDKRTDPPRASSSLRTSLGADELAAAKFTPRAPTRPSPSTGAR